jgi:SNF2 family DNA or RNA helicase
MAYAELAHTANGTIIVQTRYEEKDLIKSIPGSRYVADKKHWTVPATWPACLQLRGIFKNELQLGPMLVEFAAGLRSIYIDPLMEMRTLLTAPPEVNSANEGLYPFQHAGANFLVVAKQALLGDEMGTGKTIQLLEALRWRFVTAGTTLPAAVIAPNSTKFNWETETERWFPEAHPYVITGGAVARKKIFAAAAKDPLALVIINFEAVRSHSRLAGYGSIHLTDPEKVLKELNEIPFKTVVVDEAHRLKDPKSKQTRACWAVGHGPTVDYRYALTGTPIANDPSDLWAILHFLAPREHPTKSKYVDRYCLQSWNAYGGLSVIGVQPETREEFHRVIGPRFRRVTKDEVLTQLPRKQRQLVRVEMTPKMAKAYREMEANLATRVDGGLVIAASNLTAQIRLLQFAAATCEVESDGSVKLADPSPKVDALIDLLDAAQGKPIAVSAEYRQLIELAAKRLDKLKMPYGLITGAVSPWDRAQNLKKFQEGELPVLMFTLKAGGTGLNMTRADTMICLQRSWSMVDNKQGEDRVHRIGSEIHEAINVIDIVTSGTVEEVQIARYLEKIHRLDQITQDRARAKANGVDVTELDELEAFIMSSHLGDL